VCGRTGHPVATTPGPYRAEHLAYLVELDAATLDRIDEIVAPGTNVNPADAGFSNYWLTPERRRR
jgi:hypothetical protein